MGEKPFKSFRFIFDQLNVQAAFAVACVDLFLQALHLRCGQRLCRILAHAVPRAHRFQNVHIMLLPEAIIPISRRKSTCAVQMLVSYISFLRSEEHTSELQSRFDLVCRLLLEKKKDIYYDIAT